MIEKQIQQQFPKPFVWIFASISLLIFIFVALSRGFYPALLTLEFLTICFVLILTLKSL